MTRAAAVGGYQAKVTLVEEQGKLTLDGAGREGDSWRPGRVVPAQDTTEALDAALSALQPTPSALHLLLAESLLPKPVSQVGPAQDCAPGQQKYPLKAC